MYPNQGPAGNQSNGSNEKPNDSLDSGAAPVNPYYSMMQQSASAFPPMNLTQSINNYSNRPQNQMLPTFPFGSYPLSGNYAFGMGAQIPQRPQTPPHPPAVNVLRNNHPSQPNSHSASLTPRLESSPPLAEACLALSLASSRGSIPATVGHQRPPSSTTGHVAPKGKGKKSKVAPVTKNPEGNQPISNNSGLPESVIKNINSQLTTLNNPKNPAESFQSPMNKGNFSSAPSGVNANVHPYPKHISTNAVRPPSIPNPSIPSIPLAPDAVRYDNSVHLQQKVALYRYRDDCYKKILLKSTVSLPVKCNPPPLRKEAVKIVYDESSGSSFFRHIPRLHSRLGEVSKLPEILVPIRLDVDINGQHLADTFTWNLYDDFVSLDVFAEGLCRDMQFPFSFREPIVEAIKEQLGDFAQYGSHSQQAIKDLKISEPLSPKESANSLNELRILIKLDITVGLVSLIDQFEWDILCPLNSPEMFASILAADLGLGGEFITAIAHSIREQIYTFVKSLVLVGYIFDGGSVSDPNLNSGFLAPVVQPIRDRNNTEKFTPILVELSSMELARSTRLRDKSRRNRLQRLNRRRTNAALLPERDPIPTRRTLPRLAIEYAPTPFPLGDPAALGGGAPSPHSPFP